MIGYNSTAAVCAAAFFIGLFAVSALAQDVGCATEQSKQMSFLGGKWSVESRFRVSRNPDKWETTSGSSVISGIFPDCVWEEKYNGTRDGKPLVVTGLYGFSNVTGNLQHVWSHSQHGLLSFYEGRLEGDELIFSSEISVRGSTFILRKVFRRKAEGFEVRTERSADGGKTWDAGWILFYKRAGSK